MSRAKRALAFCAVALIAALAWHFADRGIEQSDALRDAVLDLDSRVALRERLACEPRVAAFEAIAAGVAQRLDAEARFVWFEGAGPDGRRQVQRFSWRTREVECLTCGEPGNNRRPAPHPTARAVLFDTDRFASALRPFDRELMVRITNPTLPPRPSRRLTWDAARDTHALYDPSGLGIVWSRWALAGRTQRALIRSGHGSLSLGKPAALARGGFAPARPLAWSPDARGFAVALGARAQLVDFAGEARPLASEHIAFSADGTLAARAENSAEGTRVLLGDTRGDARELALGELAAWGAPAGIALAPDGEAFALAQLRGNEERIVWAQLDCVQPAAP